MSENKSIWARIGNKTQLTGFVLLSLLLPEIIQAMPSCKTLKSRWYKRYIVDVGVSWDTSTFICSDVKKAKSTVQIKGWEGIIALALYDVETTKTAKGGPNLYGILQRDIGSLEYDSQCDPGTLAQTGGSRITICQDFMKDTREDRASTLIHEARHTEYDDPRHVTCAGGKYADDTGACDQTFYDGTWSGSGYNADIYFYSQVLRKGARNELSRAVIQAMVNGMVPDRFNEISPKAIKSWRKK